MSNHKLIMENWRRFIDPNNNLILESQVKSNKMLLNSGRSVTFGKLLESYDNKKISAEMLSEVVLKDIDKTHKQLIKEGVLDLVASAYESVKDGAIKLKDNISQKVTDAMAFVNKKYLEMVTKIYMMARKGPELAAKAVAGMDKILSAIGAFKRKHPILYKIILFTIICIALGALMMILSSDAHAEIVNQSGNAMGDKNYQAVRGLLMNKLRQTADMDQSGYLGDSLLQLKKAHNSTDQIQLETLSKANQAAYNAVKQLVAEARQAQASGVAPSDNIALQTLEEFSKIAQGTITIENIPI